MNLSPGELLRGVHLGNESLAALEVVTSDDVALPRIAELPREFVDYG